MMLKNDILRFCLPEAIIVPGQTYTVVSNTGSFNVTAKAADRIVIITTANGIAIHAPNVKVNSGSNIASKKNINNGDATNPINIAIKVYEVTSDGTYTVSWTPGESTNVSVTGILVRNALFTRGNSYTIADGLSSSTSVYNIPFAPLAMNIGAISLAIYMFDSAATVNAIPSGYTSLVSYIAAAYNFSISYKNIGGSVNITETPPTISYASFHAGKYSNMTVNIWNV